MISHLVYQLVFLYLFERHHMNKAVYKREIKKNYRDVNNSPNKMKFTGTLL